MNKLISSVIVLFAGISVLPSAMADPEWMDHASWCLKPAGATRTLAEQPSLAGDGTCGALQAGVLLTTWLSQDSNALKIATTATQYDMGVYAAHSACLRTDAGDQVAIRLLQVCQCHNQRARDVIDSNQTEILDWLRAWHAGPPQNLPC